MSSMHGYELQVVQLDRLILNTSEGKKTTAKNAS